MHQDMWVLMGECWREDPSCRPLVEKLAIETTASVGTRLGIAFGKISWEKPPDMIKDISSILDVLGPIDLSKFDNGDLYDTLAYLRSSDRPFNAKAILYVFQNLHVSA